jgi:diguanylate cyclase (GGDEF)-like protein
MDLPGLNRDSLGSPFAEQLKQGFGRLRFAGLLEKEFRDFYIGQNRTRGQLSGLIGLVLVLTVACIEFLFGNDTNRELINILRLGVLCPLLAAIVVAMYLPSLRPYYSEVAAIGVTLIGIVAIYICQLAALAGTSYLLSGVVLVLLYSCLFLGLRFNVGVSIATFLVAVFFGTGLKLGLPLDQLFYTAAILAATTVVGAISTYNLEHALRTNFLETRLLNDLAERDGLTGLYNRRIFDDFIRRIWRQSRREEVAIEIIFVDIDHFKIYNDLYGHQAGDDCLKKVAATIARSAKRPFDFAARYGGEEFVLVLYGPPHDYARTLPEQIRRNVLDLGIEHEGSTVESFVTVSVGVALAGPGSGRSLAGAVQTADEALYGAKQQGRNLVVFKDTSESEVETGNFKAAGYRDAG